MKNSILLFFCFLLFVSPVFSQDNLVPVNTAGKWGFQNKEGKLIIPCKYDAADAFSEGLSLVKKNGKYGFINDRDEIIVPFLYDEGFNFKGAQTLMKKQKDWGIIDKTGKEITTFKYQHNWGNNMRYCPTYISLRVNGKAGLVEMATGKELTAFKYDWVEVYKESETGKFGASISLKGKWGYIDLDGNEYLYTTEYTTGWLTHKGKWGYVISKGENLTPFKYDTATEFKDGYAEICINKKWGLIDSTGKEVLPCNYDRISKWEKDFTHVWNGKWAIVNAQWKEITPFKYDLTGDFNEGYATVAIKKDSSEEYTYWYSIIDMTGKELLPFEYDLIESFHGGLALAEKNAKFGFINYRGQSPGSFEYEKYYNPQPGMYFMNKKGKWGLVVNGKELTPFKYDLYIEKIELEREICEPKGGLLALRLNDKYGFIDIVTGKEVIPFKYDYVREFYDGKAEILLNGKSGFVDRSGKESFEN